MKNVYFKSEMLDLYDLIFRNVFTTSATSVTIF